MKITRPFLSGDELMDMLEEAVKYIMLGFLYKFILAHIFRRDIIASAEKFGLADRWFL